MPDKNTRVIKCAECGSDNWRCWDERGEWFESTDDSSEVTQLPVGYLVCQDCGRAWTDGRDSWPGWRWIGADDDRAFGPVLWDMLR